MPTGPASPWPSARPLRSASPAHRSAALVFFSSSSPPCACPPGPLLSGSPLVSGRRHHGFLDLFGDDPPLLFRNLIPVNFFSGDMHDYLYLHHRPTSWLILCKDGCTCCPILSPVLSPPLFCLILYSQALQRRVQKKKT